MGYLSSFRAEIVRVGKSFMFHVLLQNEKAKGSKSDKTQNVINY